MLDKLAVLIATLCGAGFLTKAPGTVGSVIAALISAFINAFHPPEDRQTLKGQQKF